MRFKRVFPALILCLLIQVPEATCHTLKKETLRPVAEIVMTAIRKGQIPGAVILIGDDKKVIYRHAFGYRSIKPKKTMMRPDTIFDIASLTKVIATTTAVMQLAENGKIDLSDNVSKYWPEFSRNGKEQITVRDLLTHYSGLRADLSLNPAWSGYERSLEKIIDEKPISPPLTRYIYSDINFMILAELVQRITGKTIDEYSKENIFKPLGMNNTFFRPSEKIKDQIAPTQYKNSRKDEVLCGEVHDPTANRMGGVAGHAGLFSDADDLSIFARMLLNNGSLNSVTILRPSSVENMITAQSPPDKTPVRGLGWNLGSPFAANREELPIVSSYYHKGYTGTGIWIDAYSRVYVIILTNRVHPKGKGDAEPLRKKIISLVSDALGTASLDQVIGSSPVIAKNYQKKEIHGASCNKIETGIDVLESKKFTPLKGMRVGLITNYSSLDSSGRKTIDLFKKAKNIRLKAIFSPEHGISAKDDRKILSAKDRKTGIPVYSLYGDVLKPTARMLEDIDALIFDVQDAGTRFYTYITTMAYAMEAAAKKKIPFYVLDRPNPINASFVHGPVMDKNRRSFTGYFPLPVRHGMTVGELAAMFNEENKIGARLHVIKMQGYERDTWYDETCLKWSNPSPNLRSLEEAILYPGVGLAESANLSVGRGTDTPFEVIGAPWISNADSLAEYLNSRNIKGAVFSATHFTPDSDKFRNQACHGVKIKLVDREALDPAALGIEIIFALNKLYPDEFQVDKTISLIGSSEVLRSIKNGQDPSLVVLSWKAPLEEFLELRAKYLLY